MTSPQLSPEQREQADKIFKEAFKRGQIRVFILGFVVAFAISITAQTAFHLDISPGWAGGLFLPSVFIANVYATRQVRKIGLSQDRTEHLIIPKTAQQFTAKPLDIRSDHTPRDGWIGVGVTLLLIALLAWHQRGGHGYHYLLATSGFFILTVCLLQGAYRVSNPPLLRLDERGVFNGAQHFWPQRAAWSRIRKAELQQVFNYKGEVTVRKLIFRTIRGRDVVVLFPPSNFSIQQLDEIVAQTEARFQGYV